MTVSKSHARKATLWTGLLVFFTTCYFQNQKPLDNANSQFALTCAIVEHGTFSIDAYHANRVFQTNDKAFFNNHFYSDKSPVTSLLGVPVFAAYCWPVRAAHGKIDYPTARYLTTCLTVGLSAAFLAMMIARALMRRGVPPARAAMAGTLWIAATPLLGYSILFYSYMPACVFLMGGALLASDCLEAPEPPASGKLLASGFLMGLACWTLNTCALGALIVTVALLWRLVGTAQPGSPKWRAFARLWPLVLGGVAGIAGYFIYVHHLFGAFASPYQYEALPFYRESMAKGLMGAVWPRWRVVWLLTFHKYHGLFLWFPITGLALAGVLARLLGRSHTHGQRATYAVALAFFASLLVYNSAYYMWWGGWAYAPRHLIPALPLLSLGLAPWLEARRKRAAAFLLAVGLIGVVFNFTAVAVDPQPPPGLKDSSLLRPELVERWPSPFFFLQRLFWVDHIVDANLGDHLGLHGRGSIVPLLLVWLMAWEWLLHAFGALPCKTDVETATS